jgi:hypothetical protein
MKRLSWLVAKLYPKTWRRRYEAEFQALLEEVSPGWRTFFDVLWSGVVMRVRAWKAGPILAAMAIVGGLVGFSVSRAIPEQYASGAVIQVLPAPGQLSLTEQSAAKSVTEVAREAFNNRKLAHLMETFGLYERERAKAPLGDAVATMKQAIVVMSVASRQDAKRSFVVQFTYPDPVMAQRVTRELVGSFMDAANEITGPPITFAVQHPPNFSHDAIGSSGWKMTTMGLTAGLFMGLLVVAVQRSR